MYLNCATCGAPHLEYNYIHVYVYTCNKLELRVNLEQATSVCTYMYLESTFLQDSYQYLQQQT